MREFCDEKYFLELASRYPDRSSVASEIVGLNAILNLPKGTEHFISDIHGEHEALSHILRCASGVVRRKVETLFSDVMNEGEISEFSTLIYYPEEKLDILSREGVLSYEWYYTALERLTRLCRLVAAKYTRAKVRERIKRRGAGYEDIIDELISADEADSTKEEYYKSIYKTVARSGFAKEVIVALSTAIRALTVDRLHIVGDIFDRGARADMVLDELMTYDSVDIQWGNHDALWMGAVAGSAACVAAVLNNSIAYRNLDVIESGYGISLRPLARFAERVYGEDSLEAYMPKGSSGGDALFHDDEKLIAKMHKAISVMQFKLEGAVILRNSDFDMNERLLLDKMDPGRGRITVEGKEYALRDCHFPTLKSDAPYELNEGEREVMEYLTMSFMRSEKLRRHISFLYEKGGMYKIFNRNLLFHGCIPLDEDGSLLKLRVAGGLSGRALMDYADKWARLGYFAKEGSAERARGRDFLWFLWCGKDSPLCARKKITTFERLLIEDKRTHTEPRNAYYRSWDDGKIADMILKEFSLSGPRRHIINGHIPVSRGDAPIKGEGKLIVIDGGFCRAYHDLTGIAGYTLIYNADGMRISAHEPFSDRESAIKYNRDILSETVIFEQARDKIRIRECDEGEDIRDKISDLMMLMSKYESGEIKEKVK